MIILLGYFSTIAQGCVYTVGVLVDQWWCVTYCWGTVALVVGNNYTADAEMKVPPARTPRGSGEVKGAIVGEPLKS